MSNDREHLTQLATDFVDAFNNNDFDKAMSYFADAANYEDHLGVRHEGKDAVCATFEPMFKGELGPFEFVGEDLFIDVEQAKVTARFRCDMQADGKPIYWRGVDILYFEGDKIVNKFAYGKAQETYFGV